MFFTWNSWNTLLFLNFQTSLKSGCMLNMITPLEFYVSSYNFTRRVSVSKSLSGWGVPASEMPIFHIGSVMWVKKKIGKYLMTDKLFNENMTIIAQISSIWERHPWVHRRAHTDAIYHSQVYKSTSGTWQCWLITVIHAYMLQTDTWLCMIQIFRSAPDVWTQCLPCSPTIHKVPDPIKCWLPIHMPFSSTKWHSLWVSISFMKQPVYDP